MEPNVPPYSSPCDYGPHAALAEACPIANSCVACWGVQLVTQGGIGAADVV